MAVNDTSFNDVVLYTTYRLRPSARNLLSETSRTPKRPPENTHWSKLTPECESFKAQKQKRPAASKKKIILTATYDALPTIQTPSLCGIFLCAIGEKKDVDPHSLEGSIWIASGAPLPIISVGGR
jgi:hypothetical protein